jgi:CRISPR-associated protein Cas1
VSCSSQPTTTAALTAAWEDLLADDRADAHLAAGTRRFATDATDRIAELAAGLAAGTYQPRPLTPVTIAKPDGGTRELAIPPVADRIVEKALAAQLMPLIDPHLGPSAYGYRAGLGVTDAVQEVVRLRAEGHAWVVHADIDNCFPTIDVPRVRDLLVGVVDDPDLLSVVDALLARPITTRNGLRPNRGLAQGATLSPALANLALEHVDARIRAAGYPFVRYGDDFLALATTQHAAVDALQVITRAAQEIHMSIEPDTAKIMSFTDGFCFLGEDFGRTTHRCWPPTASSNRPPRPSTSVPRSRRPH